MPEPARRRAVGVLAATTIVVLGATAPAVLAQSEDDAWAGSRFDPPLTSSGSTVRTETFTVSGEFVHESRPIVRVSISFGRSGDGSFDDADDDACVPADPGPVADTDTADDPNVHRFSVPDVSWPCNGTYVVRAVATAGIVSSDEHELAPTVKVAVAPNPVTSVTAVPIGSGDSETTAGSEGDDQGEGSGIEPTSVRVGWEPLGEDDLADDALGYRVVRYGPAEDGDGGWGERAVVGEDVPEGEPARSSDTISAPGTFRYLVHALRSGPDGPVPSPVDGSDVATVSVAAPPTTTTTTPQVTEPPTTQALDVPSVGRGGQQGSGNRRSGTTRTTVDPGYSETLDYDDPLSREPGEEALAGEGQSVIRTDGGTGFAAPIAGALVMLGWAGHVAYLNRLAKQF